MRWVGLLANRPSHIFGYPDLPLSPASRNLPLFLVCLGPKIPLSTDFDFGQYGPGLFGASYRVFPRQLPIRTRAQGLCP